MTSPNKPAALNSWKEIANYLGRGVRTVQRWERQLELPVHRPMGKSRSAVLAIPQELDAWVKRAPMLARGRQHASSDDKLRIIATVNSTYQRAAKLRDAAEKLQARLSQLIEQAQMLRQRNGR